MKSRQALFLHGGPGLHSEAERRDLAPWVSQQGIEMTFWDSPPGADFESCIQSAESALLELSKEAGQVHLVAHSFGAQVALSLLTRQAEWIRDLTFIAPAVHLRETLLRLILSVGAATSSEIETCDEAQADFWMQAMIRAFQSPDIFSRYWHDLAALQRWAAVMQEPEWGIRWDSFRATLASLPRELPRIESQSKPAQIILGKYDTVISRDDELRFLRSVFPVARVLEFSESAHFPHLEEPEHFTRTLAQFLSFEGAGLRTEGDPALELAISASSATLAAI